MPLIYQTKFSGGISDTERNDTTSGDAGSSFLISEHFDVTRDESKIIPYRSTEADEDKTFSINRFTYANSKLYGYGDRTADSRPKVYAKASDPITDAWSALGSGDGGGSGSVANFNMFINYKNYLMGTDNVGNLWRFGDITGAPSFTFNFKTGLSTGATGQAVIHPSDRYLYIPHDNKVAQLQDDLSTFDANALSTIEDEFTVTCLHPHGSNLAVAAKNAEDTNESFVYLWDMERTNPHEEINFGTGALEAIGNVGDTLIGVSNKYVGNSFGLGEGYISVKAYVGTSFAQEILRIKSDATIAGALTNNVIFKDSRMYFPAKVSVSGTSRIGIYVLYKTAGVLRVALDHVEEDLGGTMNIDGIFSLGNYWFIAHSGDGSVNRTNNDGNYSFTSKLETQKFTCGATHTKKTLVAAGLTFEKQPTAGTVTLKVKKETDASWSTVFAESTDDVTEKIGGRLSDGTPLPTFKEVQFRIESTGGAVPTGLWFKYTTEKNNILIN